MRVLLFTLLISFTFGGDQVFISAPKSVLTSTASFSALSNAALPDHFVACGVSGFKVWSIKATFSTTGKVDVCPSVNAGGTCDTDGATTNATALDIAIGDVLYLGFQPSTKSYFPSEVTTGVKLDGTFIAERSCVRKDYWK